MEKNELNKNAKGGTELMQLRLHNSLPKELLDKVQIIASRSRALEPNKKHVFWLHDLAQDPEVRHLATEAERKKYDVLVFVSNWQLQEYSNFLGVPFSQSVVLENAIEPIEVDVHEKFANIGDTIRIIYTPTPHRGLEILVPVFEHLSQFHDNIQLDVYSSFKLYGWEERDRSYEQLFQRCKDHPKINYHGSVSNEELREALKEAHIFAYPSIWKETSCLCLIEAMSAGCVCIHPNLAALPDTSAGQTWMYQWDEDPQMHANRFAMILNRAIETVKNTPEALVPSLEFTKVYTDRRFDWELRKRQWSGLIQSVVGEPVN